MALSVVATKLFVPPARPNMVVRPRLLARLDEGIQRKLTLISAPAGFGKTTLVSTWIATAERPAAWLSLDEEDNDPIRFLGHLVAAVQTIRAPIGARALRALQSPQPPPAQAILTALLNELAAVSEPFALVLDDYHLIDAEPVHRALGFLLQHSPPQMHLLIATREEPPLPVARLRARNQLTELRAADLRFTPSEAAEFLNRAMGFNLSADAIAALEGRTEGWIAGLQLAALSLQGRKDTAGFIRSFTGTHRFVLDYLVEEVLQQQPERIQDFLLRTSILERLCGPLCDAVLGEPAGSGQTTLEALEHANLFVVPLDSERRWYRYHHLFADVLRQRLHQKLAGEAGLAELHIRASAWYEANGLELEAFRHAAAANDTERAARLIEGGGMPLHFRGAMLPVMHWLASLPPALLDARPSLWVTYASVLTVAGQPISRVEEKLRAAEAALARIEPDDIARDLIGQIAATRAMLAIPQSQAELIMAQSRRALEYLRPDNLPIRTSAIWTLGLAYQLQGDMAAARQAYAEAITSSQASGNQMVTIAATTCLGQIQEAENQLHLAAESYRRVLELAGEPPLPAACEAHLGLARIHYQWNELDAARQHGQLSSELAPQIMTIGHPAVCAVVLAHISLAQGDLASADALLVQAEQFVRQHGFTQRMAEVAAARILLQLRQGDLVAAAELAQAHGLPLSLARVHLARQDAAAALAALEPVRRQAEAQGRADERLRALILLALAEWAHGRADTALRLLGEALAMAEPGGIVRAFVDEGPPMVRLLSEAAGRGLLSEYGGRLLAACAAEQRIDGGSAAGPPQPEHPLEEPLSQRELEILRLIASGLSNREIGERLFLALDTVKGHNRNIFSKLGAQRRTEAVARARERGLL